MKPYDLKSGEPARLFPVLSESSKEGRTISIFLSSLCIAPSLSTELLGTAGQRIGPRSRLEAFTEVVFLKDDAAIKDRPDGLIVHNTGRGIWKCLVEAKVENNDLTDEQMAKYCSLAKSNGIDAIVTVSNQFTPSPSHHPVKLSKKDQKGINLFHWSWSYILTQARLLEVRSAELSLFTS